MGRCMHVYKAISPIIDMVIDKVGQSGIRE
jgi:hypothetical protein